jgi:hypothetical protein
MGEVPASGIGLQAVGPERKGKWGETGRFDDGQRQFPQSEKNVSQTGELKLFFKDFALCLGQQKVVWVVVTEDVV